MVEHMYSAEEAAQILGLQVRTVRGYIREGRLPGRRIGKQYRIARADLAAFTAAFSGSAAAPAEPQQERAVPQSTAEVSSVVQIDEIELPAWERLERTLSAATMARGEELADLRLEPLYDAQRLRLKLIIVGSVAETIELLRIIDALTRDGG